MIRSRRLWSGIVLVMMLLSALATPVWAKGDVRIVVRGAYDAAASGQAEIVNGRVMVPLPAIPALFVGADWGHADGSDRIVSYFVARDDTMVIMAPGEKEAYVNGRKVAMDAPLNPQADGTMKVPLGFLAKALGEPIRWDGETRTVHLGSPVRPAPKSPAPQPPVRRSPPTAQPPSLYPPPASVGPVPRPAPPDINQMIDQAAFALRALPRMAPAGTLDPAALDLLMKSQGPKNVDFSGRYQLSATLTDGNGESKLDFTGEMSGAVRGQEMLLHLTQLPFGVSIAVKDGRLWLKIPTTVGWQQMRSRFDNTPANPGTMPVQPKKLKALLEAAVNAGLADITLAPPVNPSAESALKGVTVKVRAAAVLKLAQMFLPGDAGREFSAFLKTTGLQIDDLVFTQYLAPDGLTGKGNAEMALRFRNPMAPEQAYSIRLTATSGMTPGTTPLQWPKELAETRLKRKSAEMPVLG